jgi:hypothetical protein
MKAARSIALVWLVVMGLVQGARGELRVGAVQVDITPREPLPMWGYGDRHATLSEGVLDPLKASVVVLQSGKTKLAFVGLDLGRSPSEASLQRIRTRIREQTGIEHSWIAGSHTHHGPVLELSPVKGRGQGRFEAAFRYYEQLENAIVDGIVQADRQAVPARMAAGSVELENFNRNRHSKWEPVPCDRRMGLLLFQKSEDNSTLATIVNFAAHPTSLPASTLQFSADYVGAMRAVIEQELGGTAVFMQGAAGDLSTQRGPYGDHAAYGAALGREAIRLARSLEPKAVAKPLLRVREERFTFGSRTDFNNPVVQGLYSVAFFPELIANFVDEYAEGIRPRLTVALLTPEIAIVGGSGEFFCQHAMRLRERARVEHLFFFGYCNGYHQYFPTIEGAAEGGYGADAQVAPVEVGAGERLMDQALQWIFAMRGAVR